MSSIFLSYPRENVAQAHLIKNNLAARGYEVFLDIEGMAGGIWTTQLSQAIAKAENFVVLVSPAAAQSVPMQEEATQALARKKWIVPVLIDEPPADAPQWIRDVLAYQAARYDALDQEVTSARIGKLLKGKPRWRVSARNRLVSLALVLAVGSLAVASLAPRIGAWIAAQLTGADSGHAPVCVRSMERTLVGSVEWEPSGVVHVSPNVCDRRLFVSLRLRGHSNQADGHRYIEYSMTANNAVFCEVMANAKEGSAGVFESGDQLCQVVVPANLAMRLQAQPSRTKNATAVAVRVRVSSVIE